MNKLKVGLIGCGKQAPKHISGLTKTPGVEVVLADIQPELAARLAEETGLQAVGGAEALFADPEIKAVDICTPTPSHTGLIEQAVKAGKDFFCEKPLCEDLAQAERIRQILAAHDRVGMVGYIYRFAPVFEIGRQLFNDVPATGQSLELGRIHTAYLRLGGRGDHQVWKHMKAAGGGAINEMLVHMVDLAVWFFGPASQVEVLACEQLRPCRVIQGREVEVDAEDYVMVRMTTKSGVTVVCQADLVTPAFTQYLEVQGDNGTFMGSIQPDMPSFIFLKQGVSGYHEGKTSLNLGPRNLFEAQMAEFIRAVRTHEQPSRCTVGDSILLLDAHERIKKETNGK